MARTPVRKPVGKTNETVIKDPTNEEGPTTTRVEQAKNIQAEYKKMNYRLMSMIADEYTPDWGVMEKPAGGALGGVGAYWIYRKLGVLGLPITKNPDFFLTMGKSIDEVLAHPDKTSAKYQKALADMQRELRKHYPSYFKDDTVAKEFSEDIVEKVRAARNVAQTTWDNALARETKAVNDARINLVDRRIEVLKDYLKQQNIDINSFTADQKKLLTDIGNKMRNGSLSLEDGLKEYGKALQKIDATYAVNVDEVVNRCGRDTKCTTLLDAYQNAEDAYNKKVASLRDTPGEVGRAYAILNSPSVYDEIAEAHSVKLQDELEKVIKGPLTKNGSSMGFVTINTGGYKQIDDFCEKWHLSEETRRNITHLAKRYEDCPADKKDAFNLKGEIRELAHRQKDFKLISEAATGPVPLGKVGATGWMVYWGKKAPVMVFKTALGFLPVGLGGLGAFLLYKDDPMRPIGLEGNTKYIDAHGITGEEAQLFGKDALDEFNALLNYLMKKGNITPEEAAAYKACLNDPRNTEPEFQIEFRTKLREAYRATEKDIIDFLDYENKLRQQEEENMYNQGFEAGKNEAQNGTQGKPGDENTQEGTGNNQGGSGGFGMLRKYSRGPVEEETLPIVPKNNREIV